MTANNPYSPLDRINDDDVGRVPNQNERGARRLGDIVVCLMVGLLGGILFAFVGIVVGAYYGGNYATDFEFNGQRGYEATGQIGAILGFASGVPLCAWLFHIIRGRR